jgi:hypothetical protein
VVRAELNAAEHHALIEDLCASADYGQVTDAAIEDQFRRNARVDARENRPEWMLRVSKSDAARH